MADLGLIARNAAISVDKETELTEEMENKIETLRSMVMAEENLESRTDNEFLLRFLYARNFDCKRAFFVLQNYYRLRLKYPDLFENFRPSSVARLMLGRIMLIPPFDSKRPAIIVLKGGAWNPDEEGNLDEVFRGGHMFLEAIIEKEFVKKNGFLCVCDLEGFGLMQARYVTPKSAMKCLALIQDSFPVKLKGVVFYNTPAIVRIVYTIISPFIKKKFRDRVTFVGYTVDPLRKHFPNGELPEYIYNGQEYDNAEFVNSLIAQDEYFADMAKYGYKY